MKRKRKPDFTKDNSGCFNPEYFLTIPVPVETEMEFKILILVPAKPEPEINFWQNSGRKIPEFDREFCEKSKDNLKTVYFGLIWILNMKVKM